MPEWLKNENDFFRWSVISLVVFGPLYILNSYGVKLSWSIALVIALGILLTSGWKGPVNKVVRKGVEQRDF